MERLIERILLASRWLLAPLYLGLAFVLLVEVVEFFLNLIHLVRAEISGEEVHITLTALSLLDLVLVANLIVMVMLSGYENFVADCKVIDFCFCDRAHFVRRSTHCAA